MNWLKDDKSKEIPRTEMDTTGREILVYDDSGLVKDKKTGAIKNPPVRSRINSNRGREMATARHEATRQKVRNEILKRTKAANPDADIQTADDAFAFGAGETWEKSVLADKAYPRDRISAIEMISKLGDFQPRSGQPIPSASLTDETPMDLETARYIIQIYEYYEKVYKPAQQALHPPIIIDPMEPKK
jgi:hypothetical protein